MNRLSVEHINQFGSENENNTVVTMSTLFRKPNNISHRGHAYSTHYNSQSEAQSVCEHAVDNGPDGMSS